MVRCRQHKNCKGEIPKPDKFLEVDNIILNEINLIKDKVIKFMNAYMPTDALEEIWNIIRKSNTYVDSQAPWVLKNDNINRMNTVLYNILNQIRSISILLHPVIPDSTSKALDILGIKKEDRVISKIANLKFLKPGNIIKKANILFKKIENDN